MKRLIRLMPLLFLIAACGPGEDPTYDPSQDETIINFPDPKMESCIRTRAFVPDGYPIRVMDVYNLSRIECISTGITDLTGLEKMPWVVELDFNGNPITSLEPLRSLSALEKLDIGGGGVSDMSPLEDLPNLVQLYLPANIIENISSVGKMGAIRRLNLYGNKIRDVEPASLATGLENLSLYNNYIENIESLKSLLNLDRVALEGNCITDFSPIEYLKKNGKLTTATGDTAEEQDYARCQ